jgi:hypothetical protein
MAEEPITPKKEEVKTPLAGNKLNFASSPATGPNFYDPAGQLFGSPKKYAVKPVMGSDVPKGSNSYEKG